MGGGKRMSTSTFLAALGAQGNLHFSHIPKDLVQAVEAYDQEQGEGADCEREALEAVVDGLVAWFLLDSRCPRSADGT